VAFFHADTRRLAAEAAADHLLIAACRCVGPVNTGMAIFEAASESEAQRQRRHVRQAIPAALPG
jgi:hypothetical protein